MTKREIYEQVVQLTGELAQTKVAEKVFSAVAEGDAEKTQKIIDAFPFYYPELYEKIVSFGKEFNTLVGDSEEDNEKFSKVLKDCKYMMYDLAQTKVISQIAEAAKTNDAAKVHEVIVAFQSEHSVFAEKLINFQNEYTEFREAHTGNECKIFGDEVNEENGVFAFDTSIIDALSFYMLNIFGNISDVYYFVEEDGIIPIDELNSEMEDNSFTQDDVVVYPGQQHVFYDAIESATNEAFGEFVASYNIVDWVGKEERFETIGKILVLAWADEFEEQPE